MNKKSPAGGHDHEQEWPLAPESKQPPPGKALVAYHRARIVNRFARRVAELEFTIVEPIDWMNTTVTLYCALPLEGPARRRGKFFEAWTLANGAPPDRRTRMSPQVFQGYWLVELERTRNVTKRDGGVRTLEEYEEGMTQIGRLIERAAGGPPSLPTKRTNTPPGQSKGKP